MRLRTTFRMSLSSLGTHPFRATLAGLGVVFGVGAVIAMLAIGEGARREALRQIDALGIDKIILRSVPASGKGAQDTSFYGLTWTDRDHLKHQFENITDAIPVRKMNQYLFANSRRTDINVLGVTPEFFPVTRSRLLDGRGRGFTWIDIRDRTPVCLVGKAAARTLFGFEDPLGRSLQIRHQQFAIIGVIDNPIDYSVTSGCAVNNSVYLPIETANDIFGYMTPRAPGNASQDTRVEIDLLIAVVTDVGQIENTAARLRSYLDAAHPNADYAVEIPLMLLRQKERTQRIFSIVMGSIAGISLLVGGIGIMNIMLANIYERMREIGTRRALGAKRRDILLQFLLESVLLTAFGGMAGVAGGVGLARIVERYAGMPVGITLEAIVVSMVVSVGTGVVFGTFPAWKAAQLNPIDALRSE